MKRFISLLLICTLIIYMVPVGAIDMPDASIEQLEQNVLERRTNTGIEAAFFTNDGRVIIGWCEFNEPTKVYQLILPVETITNNQMYAFDSTIFFDSATAIMVEGNPDVQIFQMEPGGAESVQPHSTDARTNAVKSKLKDLHGEQYDWKEISKSTAYSPLILRVRQKLDFTVNGGGLISLPVGITIAVAGVSIATSAAGAATAAACASALANLLGVYDVAATLTQKKTVKVYTAAAYYHRYGTTQATSSATEVMYDSAYAFLRYGYTAIMDESQLGEYNQYTDVTRLAREDPYTTYSNDSPSSYNESNLLDAAYQAYLAS